MPAISTVPPAAIEELGQMYLAELNQNIGGVGALREDRRQAIMDLLEEREEARIRELQRFIEAELKC